MQSAIRVRLCKATCHAFCIAHCVCALERLNKTAPFHQRLPQSQSLQGMSCPLLSNRVSTRSINRHHQSTPHLGDPDSTVLPQHAASQVQDHMRPGSCDGVHGARKLRTPNRASRSTRSFRRNALHRTALICTMGEDSIKLAVVGDVHGLWDATLDLAALRHLKVRAACQRFNALCVQCWLCCSPICDVMAVRTP
jgi:hypothetical protein